MSQRWSLVVPVKRLTLAKSRLAGVSPSTREELALAFAVDTVAAALACPLVDAVLVVTDEPGVAHELGALGAAVVPDVPDAGLNAALLYGAERARAWRPDTGVGCLASDLPALRADDLSAALTAAGSASLSFVTDATGTGTTLLLAAAGATLLPSYGAGSAARHRTTGAVALDVPARSLRRDVDTVADLRDAVAMGVGSRTAAVVRRLDLDPRRPAFPPGALG